MYSKTALVDLVRERALEFGDFQLSSGRKAHYYLDCRRITLDSAGATLIAAGMLDLLAEEMPDLVGGMAIGADPITGAIVALAGVRDLPLRGVIVRKQSKEHGTKRFVEGPYEAGEKIVIVEVVVTTGSSSLAAIERCEEVGLEVIGVLAVVDRLEGGRAAFAERGYALTTLLTIEDLGVEPAKAEA